MSIDGSLSEGPWSKHEIIFSCYSFLKVVFHSKQLAPNVAHNTQHGETPKLKGDITDMQDFIVLTDLS